MSPSEWQTPPRVNATALDADQPPSFTDTNVTSTLAFRQCLASPEPAIFDASSIFRDESEARPLRAATMARAKELGIQPAALLQPFPLYQSRVLFDQSGRYVPSPLGLAALLIPVISGGVIDVAAWRRKTGEIGTRFGIGACLGEGQIGVDGRGTTGAPMPIFRSPLGWLKASRCGLVIVDPELAAHRLAGLILQAEDEAHAEELRRLLTLRPPEIRVACPSWNLS